MDTDKGNGKDTANRSGQAAKRPQREMRLGRDAAAGIWSEYVSVATAARLLGVSRRTVHYLLDDGRLQGVRIPPRGWWKVRRESLRRLIPTSRTH